MTQYIYRATVACRVDMLHYGNALATAVGEQEGDGDTFTLDGPRWQSNGEEYRVASAVVNELFVQYSESRKLPTKRPYMTDAEYITAAKALSTLEDWSLVAIGLESEGAAESQLASLGLTPIHKEDE